MMAACKSIPAMAQTYRVLHTFTGGADGADPRSLIVSGNTLYGTTFGGVQNTNSGTLFSINTDGTGYSVLHVFAPLGTVFGQPSTNADGSDVTGSLTVDGGTLYGVAEGGGTNGWGTIFSFNLANSNFDVVYTFPGFVGKPATNLTGNNPIAGLLLSSNLLYGLTSNGGSNHVGTMFSFDP